MLEINIIILSTIIFAIFIFFKFFELKENVIYVINNNNDIDTNDNKEAYAIIDLREDQYDSHDNLNTYDIYEMQYSKLIEIQNCEELLGELLQCYYMKNQLNKKCQKLYEERVNDLIKCKMMISNFSLEGMKKNIINFELDSGNDKGNNYDYYFKEEDDTLILEDLFKLSKDYNLKEEIEIDDINFQEEPIIENKEKENFIIVDKRDCIEYELSKKDNNYIVCNKYE